MAHRDIFLCEIILFSYHFADGYEIQVGTIISSTVNDLNPRRVDEFLLAFGRTCFKVS